MEIADHVTVTFTHLDMGRSENWNYIEVFEGEGLDGPSRGKWMSNVIPLPITSNGNALTVNLHSFTFGNVSFTYTVLNSGKQLLFIISGFFLSLADFSILETQHVNFE